MNFKTNFRYGVIYIFFLCLLLPACKQSNDTRTFKKKRPLSTQQFNVQIHGVECALCEQCAIDTLKKINGIQDVICKVVDDDYDHAIFQIYYDPEQFISLETINGALEREGFAAELT